MLADVRVELEAVVGGCLGFGIWEELADALLRLLGFNLPIFVALWWWVEFEMDGTSWNFFLSFYLLSLVGHSSGEAQGPWHVIPGLPN